MSQIDYEKHSKAFFIKIDIEEANYSDTSIYDSAYEYVKEECDFKYKDPIEVGALLSVLQNKGLIEFLGYKLNMEKYKLTEKGKEQLLQKYSPN